MPLPDGLSLFDAMAIGTAGFTAALSVVEMERNGLAPSNGPVIATGATRMEVWRRHATDLKPAHLVTATRSISLGELHDRFAILLKGQARGRFVVDLPAA